jgi:adenosylmethionine-8-amino-7-oxononanoate aminotransferase
MSHLIHRQLHAVPPRAVSAQGCWIRDADGKDYLDASGGAAVSSLGHGNAEVIAAISSQANSLAYAHSGFFTTDPAEELGELLAGQAPGDMLAYLVSGGSEAMESALKLARQYFVELEQPERRVFIARRQSYHGNTLGALAVGGNEWRRRQFAPLLVEVRRVAPCYEYRDRAEGVTVDRYTALLLRELETAILEAGPENVIGFCAETVVGATAGALPPTPGYFRGVRGICDKYSILMIVDEVMCGMGRCGSTFAITQDDAIPDIIAVGKGLAAGYQPAGAMLAQRRVVDAIRSRSGAFQHGHTYCAHPVAAAAALAVQKIMARDRLSRAAATQGDKLRRLLKEAFAGHPHVGDVRGRGLLIGLELVQDRASQTPFPPARKLHAAIRQEAMARGLMVYPMGGTIDGMHGDHVLLAPPFTISDDELSMLVDRLADSLDAALRRPAT